ncbi:MAG: Fic family protein [Flavobacteriales bacterium]|nr:Fic family protein [Flavobacteriales bacterium]
MKPFRSGKFIQQYKYKSFLPTLLKESFDWRSATVLNLLEKASAQLGELNSYSKTVPDINFFIEMHKTKEATTSSRIEGTRTSIDEAVLSENNVAPERRDDWEEVQNYIKALNHSVERLGELPLCIRLLREAHEILLSGVRGENKLPGIIRTSQNWIGGADIKSASFIPPHHNDLLNLLTDLENFWHEESSEMPYLIKAAITHYQFETIHPFLDGNGRIGRLLITLQLLDAELLDRPTLYISDFFEKNRSAYYDALMTTRRSNDMDHWLRLFLTGVIETAESSKKTFVQIGELRKSYTEQITQLGRRSKLADKLLLKMYSNPIMSPREVESELGIAPATANRLLKAMEQIGLVKEKSGRERNRLYVLHAYLNVFKA